ncbi:MAG: hypothetical protein JWO82_622, partial [Akkermansiaceae bacterium]|nr:hypothetical protein [Akkermansiaceae bacterium]
MQRHSPCWKLLLCFLALSQANGQDETQVKKIIESSGSRLSNSTVRDRTVADMRALSTGRRQAALARAAALGIRQDGRDANGRRYSLIRFDGNRPRYYTSYNANAAISTGANLLQAAPASLNGSGFTFGLWDGGLALSFHQELNGRVTPKDSADYDDHATHVAGTLAAFGVKAAAKGMSPGAKIDSYDWFDDFAELADRAATYPGEPGKLYISNHSYGLITGYFPDPNAANSWDWYGDGTLSNSIEQDFGRYSDDTAAEDAIAYAAPYFLMFRAAGNDRDDNPVAGDQVYFFSTGVSATYDPAKHPKGDGTYRNGFENIAGDALAKNLMTVGSVGDAVTSGSRDPSKAAMSEYSSWGPTDDGRIKPDVVANGETLYSSVATGSSDYDTYSGTSMASPNAAGSSMLLVQLYNKLFPGQYMRASTLKGLIIQTCDDLGNPGPDYKYGWGLVNVKAAADLLNDQSANPGKNLLSENQLNSAVPSRTETLTWDGVSPIRATLSWTDPAATEVTTSDSRAPRLVNDLNLRIVGPNGTTYRPFVMPFVGIWTEASMNLPATTGINTTDNVEQVLIQSPVAGDYQVIIDTPGALSSGSQTYSLIISGSASRTLPAPILASYTPQAVAGGANDVIFTATGTGFHTGASVVLIKDGGTSVAVDGLQVTGEAITGHLDTGRLSTGIWDLKITNPDGQSITVTGALTADGSLWAESFDTGNAGWTHNATGAGDLWTWSTINPRSPTRCFRANGPNSVNLNNLISPLIPVPGNAAELTFTFWQACAFTTGDGG